MTVYHSEHDVTLHQGDAATVLATLPEQSVNCVVTSPPYFGLRDYGVDGQLGLEPSPAEYVAALVEVFCGVRRVLRDDGVAWLNLGDSYNAYNGNRGSSATGFSRNEPMPSLPQGAGLSVKSLGPKNLIGIPWRVAFALQDDGWTLRNAAIWHKPNAMPESVTDRLSCRYEHVFLLSKSRRYWFNLDPIREPLAYPRDADGSRVFGGKNKTNQGGVDSTLRRRGGNAWTPTAVTPDPITCGTTTTAGAFAATAAATSQRTDSGTRDPVPTSTDHTSSNELRGRNPGDVWTVATSPFPGAHFATMPPALARRCILSGCPEGGTVLDPFTGSGTTGMVARQTGRKFVGIDLNPAYLALAVERIGDPVLDFGGAA